MGSIAELQTDLTSGLGALYTTLASALKTPLALNTAKAGFPDPRQNTPDGSLPGAWFWPVSETNESKRPRGEEYSRTTASATVTVQQEVQRKQVMVAITLIAATPTDLHALVLQTTQILCASPQLTLADGTTTVGIARGENRFDPEPGFCRHDLVYEYGLRVLHTVTSPRALQVTSTLST